MKIANHLGRAFPNPARVWSGGAAFALAAVLAAALCLPGCGQSTTEHGGSAGAGQAASAETAQQEPEGAAQDGGSSLSAQGLGARGTATGSADDSAHGDSLDADRALEGQTDAHPVSFSVDAPGYTSADGKIPIAVAGQRSDGTAVDATAYLGPDGSGLELSPGTYTVTVIESPLMAGGTFLRAPGKSWSVTVGDSLAAGQPVTADGAMTFTRMDLSELTSDEVETAYTYAVSGGLPTATAKEYRAQLLKAAGLS